MRIDRTHLPWAVIFLLGTALAATFYLATFYPEWLPVPFDLPRFLRQAPRDRHTVGGSALGLIFGILAAAIFVFGSALSIRKKKRLWPLGDVKLWLRAHIWLTFFTIPLVALHCGFRAGGPHTSWLLVVYAVVMGSGIFGLLVQQFIPQMMKERLPSEVVFEQIPHIREKLFEAALMQRSEVRALEKEVLAAVASVPAAAPVPAPPHDISVQSVGQFLDDECLPYLRAGRGKAGRLRLGKQQVSDDLFRHLKLRAAEKLWPFVDNMQQWCDDRRNMDLQVTLHHWLHGWLLLHVPFSFALLVITAWHIYIEVAYL